MSIFDRTLATIEEKRKYEFNCIPWGLPRYERIVPGIMQKTYYLVTANTGIGKTQFTDEMFMYRPLDFVHNTETDIKVRIFYWSLEVSKESKIVQGIARQLYVTHNLTIPYNKILSMSKSRMSDEEYHLISQTKDYFNRLEDVVTINDEYMNPYGIYKELKAYAHANGTLHYKPINKIVPDGQGGTTTKEELVFDYYEPNNPNEYVISICDHYGLLHLEQGLTIKQTIEKHSRNNVIVRNMFGYIPVGIQQQAADKEELEFFRGNTIESKLLPSLQGLAESKLTGRDCDIALGLFSPARHEIKSFRGYNTAILKDNFRSLHTLKYRHGTPNSIVPLYFDGAVNMFSELPDVGSQELELIYRSL